MQTCEEPKAAHLLHLSFMDACLRLLSSEITKQPLTDGEQLLPSGRLSIVEKRLHWTCNNVGCNLLQIINNPFYIRKDV